MATKLVSQKVMSVASLMLAWYFIDIALYPINLLVLIFYICSNEKNLVYFFKLIKQNRISEINYVR